MAIKMINYTDKLLKNLAKPAAAAIQLPFIHTVTIMQPFIKVRTHISTT